jgi:hypothetical protein
MARFGCSNHPQRNRARQQTVVVDGYCSQTQTSKTETGNTSRCTGTTPQKKCFENHFGVTFTVTPKEEKNNIVTVIPEADPKAIAAASANNVSIPLTFASADHDCNFCQIAGTSPVTEQFNLQSIFNNRARNMCRIQEVRRVGLMVLTYQYYHGHDFPDLPRNLEGGISLYGLVPLQSI